MGKQSLHLSYFSPHAGSHCNLAPFTDVSEQTIENLSVLTAVGRRKEVASWPCFPTTRQGASNRHCVSVKVSTSTLTQGPVPKAQLSFLLLSPI